MALSEGQQGRIRAMPAPRVIPIEPCAPSKPAWGAACNGCGVCCLAEPCPLGMLWSRRRRGACAALSWDAASGQYRCGVLVRFQHWPWAARWVRRWIGAGQGCDCQWEFATDAVASSKASEKLDEESLHGPQ